MCIIKRTCRQEGQPVAILVDEYDKQRNKEKWLAGNYCYIIILFASFFLHDS